MAARYLVFFAVALLVMGSAHYYIWARLVRDVGLPEPWPRVGRLAIVALFLLLMSVFVLVRTLPRSVAAPFTWVGYIWLGVVFFLVMSLGLSDLVKVIS